MTQKFSLFLMGRLAYGITAAVLLPLCYSLAFGQEGAIDWLLLLLLYGALAVGLSAEGRRHQGQIDPVFGAQVMLLLWGFMAFLGMLPYFCLGYLSLSDALFESVSTITTTGITLLPEEGAETIKLWRAALGWLGGLNFLLLLVTIMPAVSGYFGLTLAFRRGIVFSSVLEQMTRRGKQIAGVYAGCSVLSWLLFCLAGVNPWVSLKAALLIISTTGGRVEGVFNTDGNYLPETVAIFSLFLAAGNFLRYWRTWQRRDFRDYYQNPEVKFFLRLTLVFGLIVAWLLWGNGIYPGSEAILSGCFQVLSFAATAGVNAAETYYWPDEIQFLLLILAICGGCLGSATGGLKIVRVMVLWKMLKAEAKRTLHPRMVVQLAVGKIPVPDETVGRIMCFFFLYASTLFLLILLLGLTGLKLYEAAGMATACFTTLGCSVDLTPPGEFGRLGAVAKMICCLFMLIARAEIFALLVIIAGRPQRKWLFE